MVPACPPISEGSTMQELKFVLADHVANRSDLIDLNVEYLSWVFGEVEKSFGVPADQVVGMPASEYVPTVIHKVCGDPAPLGAFYLIFVDGQVAGMGGLRRLRDQVAEVKRIYVRPIFRGLKLGDQMLARLLADAVDFGYPNVLLDTGEFMTAAHRIYEAQGFVDCPAYEETEVPEAFRSRWRFMKWSLPNEIVVSDNDVQDFAQGKSQR